jgi:hypothetical protein
MSDQHQKELEIIETVTLEDKIASVVVLLL